MVIGIVGPELSVKRIHEVIKKEKLPIELVEMIYSDYRETIRILKQHQVEFQAVLFTGIIPYELAIHNVCQMVPWEFLRTEKLELMYALLKANQQYDISRISYDSQDAKNLINSYSEIGLNVDTITVLKATERKYSQNYIETIVNFHRESYQSGKATCCVVGMAEAYSRLREEGIPAVFVERSRDAVMVAVNKLRLAVYHAQGLRRFAVLAIEVRFLAEHLAYNQSPLQLYELRHQVGIVIYKFAQRVGAAVIEAGSLKYYLFSNETAILNETEQYKKISLLRELHQNDIVKHVFIGIGFDSNAFLAKQSADTALRKASSGACSQAFIVEHNQKIFGPIFQYAESGEEIHTIDRMFLAISQKTGVGIQMLGRLDAILKENGLQVTTSVELARLCGMSVRNFNRILAKLEAGGYVEEVGREARPGRGRPGRLIRLKLDNE